MFKVRTPIPKLFMKLQGIKYGKKCEFYGLPVILRTRDSEISLGNGVVIKSGFLSNLIGLYQRSIIFARAGGSIILEDDVRMSGITIYARNLIHIGKHTNIGGNTKIFDHDFHPIDPNERLEHPDAGMSSKKISIGENVFIGCNVIILKGTELGDNCVVGAGSVVSGKFANGSVIVGNPARVIKIIEGDCLKT